MAKDPKNPDKAPSFEEALRELEVIVAQLEAGEKPLEESLGLYERGVAALRRCHGVLDKADQRIRVLVQNADASSEVRDVDVAEFRKGRMRPRAAGRSSGDAQNIADSENLTVDEPPPARQNSSFSKPPAESRNESQPGTSGANAPNAERSRSPGEAHPEEDAGEGGSLFASTE